MKILVGGWCALIVAVVMSARPAAATTSCESLTSLTLPNATITLARPVDAGAFAPADPAGGGAQPLNAPRAFCRVAATLKPSSDSDIKVEVWMPAANWNGTPDIPTNFTPASLRAFARLGEFQWAANAAWSS